MLKEVMVDWFSKGRNAHC